MKKSKRVFCVILAMVMILTCLSLTVFATDIERDSYSLPSIEIDVSNAIVGQEMTVTVSCINMENIGAGIILLSFDDEYLEYISSSETYNEDYNDLIVSSGIQLKHKNVVGIGVIALNTLDSNKLSLLSVTFRAVKAGETEITCNMRDFIDSNYDDVSLSPNSSLTNIHINTLAADSDYIYSVLPDGTAAIMGYIGTETEIIIPSEVDGYTVASIGESVFKDYKLMTSITIPESVTSIRSYAFSGCDNLSDVYYGGTDEQWSNIDIGNYNGYFTSAIIHFNGSQHKHTWSDWTEKTPATCTEKGVETRTCSVCNVTETREIELTVHSFGDWTVANAATALKTGTETRTCLVCGNTETREIPKIEMTKEVKDEKSGIAVQYKDDSFNSEIKLNVEQKFDGESYQIINKEKQNFKYELFDITITSNGEKVQPNGSVLVKMPVPEEYNTEKLSVYYVTNSGTLEKMNFYYENGYVYFEASHFSDYVLVDESENQAPKYIKGDVNNDGKVTASDARLVLRISASLETATDIQFLAADVDESKKITASDARTILRVSAELEKFKVK